MNVDWIFFLKPSVIGMYPSHAEMNAYISKFDLKELSWHVEVLGNEKKEELFT